MEFSNGTSALGAALVDGGDRVVDGRHRQRLDRRARRGGIKRVLAEGPGRAGVGDSHGRRSYRTPRAAQLKVTV